MRCVVQVRCGCAWSAQARTPCPGAARRVHYTALVWAGGTWYVPGGPMWGCVARLRCAPGRYAGDDCAARAVKGAVHRHPTPPPGRNSAAVVKICLQNKNPTWKNKNQNKKSTPNRLSGRAQAKR